MAILQLKSSCPKWKSTSAIRLIIEEYIFCHFQSDAIIEKLDRLFVDAPGITSSKAGIERIHLLSSIQSNQTLHTLILVSFNYICVSFSFLSINVKLNQTRFYNHTYWVMYSMLFWNSIIKREATLALKRTRNQSHCSFWKLLQWFIQIFC